MEKLLARRILMAGNEEGNFKVLSMGIKVPSLFIEMKETGGRGR